MRLILHLRGVDLLNVEFHGGSKGVFLDVDWFKPVADDQDEEPVEGKADLTGTTALYAERAEPFGDPDTIVQGNGWSDAGRPRFGF